MIPQAHRQEALHRAYVTAVAAQAGIKATFSTGAEYGVDGEFRLVTERVTTNGNRVLSEAGYPLDFQMKSTTMCRNLDEREPAVSYDCDVDAYNKILLQNRDRVVPILLLVLCLPTDRQDWLSVTQEGLVLRRACYWHYIQGEESTRKRSQVIRIPQLQLFTADALTDIMSKVQAKG